MRKIWWRIPANLPTDQWFERIWNEDFHWQEQSHMQRQRRQQSRDLTSSFNACAMEPMHPTELLRGWETSCCGCRVAKHTQPSLLFVPRTLWAPLSENCFRFLLLAPWPSSSKKGTSPIFMPWERRVPCTWELILSGRMRLPSGAKVRGNRCGRRPCAGLN